MPLSNQNKSTELMKKKNEMGEKALANVLHSPEKPEQTQCFLMEKHTVCEQTQKL